ncbi:MAG: AAA family ATPase, partial [Candidatus Omnitrophota bacterium]|nr:AAA family ATPase [Candidatus Omnitrophota bacterium]
MLADEYSSTLSPWLKLHSGEARRLMYFALHVPRLMYAESDASNTLLERYCADALLLQNGSYLIDKSVFDYNENIIQLFAQRDISEILKEAEADPHVSRAIVSLTRVVLHENIEKLMRVIAATDSNRYLAMKSYVLSQKEIIDAYGECLSASLRKRALTGDLLFNDIVASAFEIILLRNAGIVDTSTELSINPDRSRRVDKDELSPAEAALAEAAKPVFAANRHNYFTAEFWDERELNKAVTRSLHIGYVGPIVAHPKRKDRKFVSAADERPKALREKIAILTRDLKFEAPDTFEKRLAFYYVLRLALIADADQDKAEDFRLHYRRMLALLGALAKDLKTVKDDEIAGLAGEIALSGEIPDFVLGQPYTMSAAPDVAAAIRKELTDLTTLEFDKRTRRSIDDVIEDVVNELYDDDDKRASMKKELAEDIKTYHFANIIPIDSLDEHFSINRESYRDKLIALPAALGSYACKITGEDLILTHIFGDDWETRSSLVHEIFHYLMDRGEIKAPAEAESITFTAQFLDAITHVPVGDTVDVLGGIERMTGLPLFRELLSRGKELGLRGEVGFKVLPGITGERAEYFSLKGLLLEAQIIYRDNGRDPAALDGPYEAQMAIAAMLTGQLLGLHEKEGIKPLRLLKDFFNDLGRRLAPPSPGFLAWINAEGGLLSELKRYASYLFAKRMALLKKAEGLWGYEDKSELSGAIYYVETDLYPRLTDGMDEFDFKGKKEAVRERAFAQLILAVSRELYGRHDLAERSIPEWKERPERQLLWDAVLTASTVYAALGRNQARVKDRDDKEKYRGAGRWITKLFRDRYRIGNPVIERALLTSLPLHLQYLDSILYRWVFYEKKKGDLTDPRLVNGEVKQALVETQGDAENPGWEGLMFHPAQFKDDEIAKIVLNKIMPAYERLYEDAVKESERKAAYDRMIKEEKAERVRKAFDQLTEEELDAIDRYIGALSEEDRREIKERVKEELDKALKEYMNQSQGGDMPFMDEAPREGAPGMPGVSRDKRRKEGRRKAAGQEAEGRGQQGPGETAKDAAGLNKSLDSLKEKMDAIERNIDRLSGYLNEAESKAVGAGKISKVVQDAAGDERRKKANEIDGLAAETQKDVNASLQSGRDVEADAARIDDTMANMAEGLPEGEKIRDGRDNSRDIRDSALELRERLERLQEKANRLKSLADRLKTTVSGGEVDQSHVRGQSDAISDTVGTMKGMIRDIKGKEGEIEGSISNLEGDLKAIEQIAHDIDNKRRGAVGEGAGKSEEVRGEGGARETKLADGEARSGRDRGLEIAPADDTLEGLADIARKCGSDLTEDEKLSPRPEERRSIFDDRFLKGLTQEEAERSRLREPLNDEEQRRYDEWLKETKPLIDRMTEDLRARLNIPTVGIDIETGQWTGPKLKDLVKGVMGLPPFAKRHEREPRNAKITLLVDRSGSMQGDAIKYAALTVFALLKVILNLNEERDRLGFAPIEFEVGLFTTDDEMSRELQISHQTVADKPHICPERLIYDIMRKIQAGGGTDDVSALGRYVTRIIESPDRGEEGSYRIFFSIGDANLGTDANAGDIQAIIQKAKESGVHIFGVSIGDDTARAHMREIYGAENSILPKSLADTPNDIMTRLGECIPMPGRAAGRTTYLSSIVPFALGFDLALKAASKFLLSAGIDSARNARDLKKVDGYRHFYIERSGAKEYLVFIKDGVPERRWERGAGGGHVPQTKVPDIETNEELMLSILRAQKDFGQENLIELIGETGLGKGEILRAAAHLLNEEYYFVAGNEDMEVEELSETRSLGNAAAGVSSYEPSIVAQVQHNGGWVVLDERHKIPQKVLNELKSHLSGRNHVWNEEDADGKTVKKTLPNHPRARIFSTINPHRAGIQSAGGLLDQAMQRRVKRIEFTWLLPEEEVRMQAYYARQFAEEIGKGYSGELKSDIEDLIERLVRIATKERLTFAGYNAGQIGRIIADWRLLKDHHFRPANKRGEYLKRPPSPRVIKSIIRHMILYPADLKHRQWSVVSRYFNYAAENDKLNTFSNVMNDFRAEGIVDEPNITALKLDSSSFFVEDSYLIVRPLSAPGEKPAWDDVRVPLHPAAAIRKGELPDRVKFWIRSPGNALIFYEALQSLESGRDLIFVGEQETGKSRLAETIAELLSGPELEILAIVFSTSKEDITFIPHIGEDGTMAFQSGYKAQRLPRTMDDGKGHGKVLIMEETTQGRPGVIGLLNEVAERGELPYPFSQNTVRKQKGSVIIHTINPPTRDFEVNAFSDEFLERHTILGFTPLPPEESRGYISDASKRSGLQVHPRLIGEIERDDSGSVVMINGGPRYKGILGIEQYIRGMRAKDPNIFPRAPGVGTNMDFALAIRNNYEFTRAYHGFNSQETIMRIFTGLFTLDGPEEKVREWYKVIKEAFVYARLWTDQAGKDAVDEYLRGEDVLVERLPVLRPPHTDDIELDRMLTYIQENTRGGRFKETIAAILKRCAELYDDNAWRALGFTERVGRVYTLKEIYQIARAVLRERSAEMYDREDWKNFELMAENIVSNLLVKKLWPDEALISEYSKGGLTARYEGIVSCGDMELDDLIGKMALFGGDADYARETQNTLARSLIAFVDSEIRHPLTERMLKVILILSAVKKSILKVADKKPAIKDELNVVIGMIDTFFTRNGIDFVVRRAADGKLSEKFAEWTMSHLSNPFTAEETNHIEELLKNVADTETLEALYSDILGIFLAANRVDNNEIKIAAGILNYIWRLAHAPPASLDLAKRLAELRERIAQVTERIAQAQPKAVIAASQPPILDPSKLPEKPKAIFEGHTNWVQSAIETSLKTIDNLPVFMSASDDKTVRFFSLDINTKKTKELARFEGHTNYVRSAIETSLKTIDNLPVFMSASGDKTVRFFSLDINTKKTI